ncbi:MAG: zeta toxin family protein [Phycisphaerae bacterium]|nr:zeta toxin family protein [Phycisphaerae bacterium]
MIGDKLVITEYHRAAAAKALDIVRKRLGRPTSASDGSSTPLAVSIAGESGCGKTETAHCLAEAIEAGGRTCLILSQDDYFRLPPKSNHARRLEDISWVGLGEVQLDLLDAHITALKEHPDKPLTKPLVHFEEDRIGAETIAPGKHDVVIVEGTYTSLLPSVDVRVFINRNYRQTKKARLTRARDPDVDFMERVLEIEHKEISKHRARADVIIDPPPEEQETDG